MPEEVKGSEVILSQRWSTMVNDGQRELKESVVDT